MKIQRSALVTLATLATLVTACDTEPVPSADELSFRGDELDPVPPTTGGIIIVKGGHDWDDICIGGWERAPIEFKDAFRAAAEKQAHEFVVATFLADEHVMAECPWICEEQHMSWNEGVEVHELQVRLGAVSTVEDETGFHWESEATVSAQTSCGCE